MTKFLKRPAVVLGLVALLGLILGGYFYFGRKTQPQYEVFKAKLGDIVQEVSVTGRVKAAESVELAFERAGRVSWVGPKAGDKVFAGQVLALLSNADLRAALEESEANLKAEEAGLAALKRGTRAEAIKSQEAKVADAKQNLLDKLFDAYTKSDDGVRNRADQLFSNPQTSSPKLTFISDNATALEGSRVAVEAALKSWLSRLVGVAAGSDADFNAAVFAIKNDLALIKNFLEQTASAVNGLKAGGPFTQATIDAYRSDLSTARTNVNTAINNLSSAEADLTLAKRELDLKNAGTSTEELGQAEAEVLRARAGVSKAKAELSKTFLVAPFSGTLTREGAKMGETIAANSPVAAMISEAQFEIEANVPEVDIAKIKPQSTAKATLDAYGSEVVFEAKVSEIEPAETIIEGVATYKTTLQFLAKDERIRSGMTANIDILGAKREQVLIIPERAVISSDGRRFVKISSGGQVQEREVRTGLRGSDGNVEIISGLSEGEEVFISLEK